MGGRLVDYQTGIFLPRGTERALSETKVRVVFIELGDIWVVPEEAVAGILGPTALVRAVASGSGALDDEGFPVVVADLRDLTAKVVQHVRFVHKLLLVRRQAGHALRVEDGPNRRAVGNAGGFAWRTGEDEVGGCS